MQYWSPDHWVLSPHSSRASCVAIGVPVADGPATDWLWEAWELPHAGVNSNETPMRTIVSVLERMGISAAEGARHSRLRQL